MFSVKGSPKQFRARDSEKQLPLVPHPVSVSVPLSDRYWLKRILGGEAELCPGRMPAPNMTEG